MSKSKIISAEDFMNGVLDPAKVREIETEDTLIWRTKDEFIQIHWEGTLKTRVIKHLVDTAFEVTGGDGTVYAVIDVTRDGKGGATTTRETFIVDSPVATLWAVKKPKTIIEKAVKCEPGKEFTHRKTKYRHLEVMELMVLTKRKSFMVRDISEKK